jgi:hypothetical protein
MSIIDRLFVGRVIQDFGTLEEKSFGIGKMKRSALLVEKHGRVYFVIKSSAWVLFGASVSYHEFTLDNAFKLRESINQSEQIARNLPPLTYDVSKVALRNALVTSLIASVISLLAQDVGIVFLATLIAMIVHASQATEFRSHPSVDSRTKGLLMLVPLFTLLIGIAKFAWLNFAK